MATNKAEDWLARYANNHHAWKTDTTNGKPVFQRPLGLVESSFDVDGTDFGGRADMNALFTLEIRHTLASQEDFRQRIALAWASLRLQHVMLQSKVQEDEATKKRSFVIGLQDSKEEVTEEASKSIIWVEDLYSSVDGHALHRHCLNVARIIDPSQCLSRLHVLPLQPLPNGNFELQFLIIMAHQISDGLTAYNWFSHFLRILNTPVSDIERDIDLSRTSESIATRLPLAQEDMYPPVATNKARARWFWAIMRVLRHVAKKLPPTFVNPLRRDLRLAEAVSFPPTFAKLFDYSEERKPPMNSGHCVAALSKTASNRLIELSRSIKVSMGAGCFALAGLAMMEIEEKRYPDIPDSERRPFAASFPLNPRAFFGFITPPDSCMLAFSDGVVMPFLPSSLPIEARFKLTAKQANRQLRVYQKRLKTAEVNISLEPHSSGRLLANGYLYQIERVEAKLPSDRKTGFNPQGKLPANTSQFGATCGVSSVGPTAAFLRPGTYDFNDLGKGEGKDLVADFRDFMMGVRARDNEFLVGSSTDSYGVVKFGVSYDESAISEDAAEAWAEKINSLLEPYDKRSEL
ncbi:hypothetical protein K505DRAFT_329849 [Melanomma pulvis-pyrius CBS 109.77]|uniref:CoA-dependent acyltransferase n=1 Tax=Melanomma pulvis-pyrius CBS 109.77 TaxID=1314802 RepID=A0A6A6WT78_9PLEO|nr:hypothetical protein K505DRAFT_329849 [Melanomma pulvis-pyrius CBS 109.77]